MLESCGSTNTLISFIGYALQHYTTQGLVGSKDAEPQIRRADCKVTFGFTAERGVGSANLRSVQRSKTIVGWGFNVGASQVVVVVKYPSAKAGDIRDTESIPGSVRAPGVGNGNPLQYSCREDPMDRGVWWALVFTTECTHTHTHTHTHAHTL